MTSVTATPDEIVIDVEGRSTLFGINCQVTKDGIEGWTGGGVPVRRKAKERLWTHGEFSVKGKRGARAVTITGVAWADTRGDAGLTADLLNAVLADGREGKITVIDPDVGIRWAHCFLFGAEIDWQDNEVTFSLELICSDPRKYGQLQQFRTGIAQGGDGLRYPLFAGGPFTLQRTNLATNPRVNSATNWAVRSYGTGGTGTAAFNGGAGYVGNGFYRMTYTAAATAGPLGPWYTQAVTGGAGDVYSARIAVRASVAKSWFCRVGFYNGATLVNEVIGAVSVAAGANAWVTPEVIGAAATGPFTQIRVGATPSNATVAIGVTIDAGAVQLEASAALGAMFSGSTVDTAAEVYQWTGTADASTSTVSTIDGARGVLDFGEPGDMGTITFTNYGYADTYPNFRVRGYTTGFTITEIETGRRLIYNGEVPMYQDLYLNAFNGAVYLETIEANRLTNMVRTEWPVIPGKERRTYRFESPEGEAALLFMEVAPAWW